MQQRNLGLDLLRAIAVLMVLASHWAGRFNDWWALDWPAMVLFADRVGDTGVELFFALSGFLIGRILITLTRGKPGWRDYGVFMARRGLRTLPLYFLWLALLLALFPPGNPLATALRYATLTQNLITQFPNDYFFAVTWSLSIEEWFYLLFASLLVALARSFGSNRALAATLAVFLLVPLGLRIAAEARGSMALMRIDEIGYGVIAAWLYLERSRLFQSPWPLLATGLALIAVTLAEWPKLPPALVSNAQVIGCALCLPAALRLTKSASWCERPVRWIASRSYALYLTHVTILVDVVEHLWLQPGITSPAASAALAILLPFPLAELSYRFVEAPILQLRPGGAVEKARPTSSVLWTLTRAEPLDLY